MGFGSLCSQTTSIGTSNQESSVSLKISKRFSPPRRSPHPRLNYLATSLDAAIAKVRGFQGTLPQLRLTFGLACRLYLEAFGYIRYHTKYWPILESPGKPTAADPTLVGVWVQDVRVCTEYFQMGVPVWLVRKPSQVLAQDDKFVKFCQPRPYRLRPLWPPDSFKDDGYVKEEFMLLDRRTDTRDLMKVVNSWLAAKLEGGFG